MTRLKLPATLRALSHRNFQLYFGGQIISLTGTWMQNIAQAWLVYRITGSSLLLGLVSFAGQIPVFLLATIGGVAADHFNRHKVVITTQTAAMILAFVFATLTLSGTIQVWQIFILATMLGIVNAFDIPARQSFVVEMVGKEDLINAIALNSSMFNGARIVGPAVAGVLVASIGEGWCFFWNGVSFIAVILGLLLMNLTRRQRSPRQVSMFEHTVQGFKYAGRTKPVRAILLLLGLSSLVGMPYAVLMPIFADQILHGGARGLGLLMGATGVGALLGAITLASRKGLKGLVRWVAFASSGFGLFLILFSQSRAFWLSAALLVPAGYAFMIQMASSNTLIQSMVPDDLRGRVMAVYSMMFMGMAPFGALLAGTLASTLGAPLTVALGGALCIAGSALFMTRLPGLRIEAREIIIALQTAAGDPSEEMTGEGPSDK